MPALHSFVPLSEEFESVYLEHFDFVWANLRRLGVHESGLDDATQDVFLVVHRRLGEFEGRSSIRTWLFGIVRRVAADHRRRVDRHDRHEELSTAHRDDGAVDPFRSVADAERAELIYQLLGALDVRQREVFVLAEIEEMTGPAIADCLDVKLETVYARLRAARASFERAVRRWSLAEGRRLSRVLLDGERTRASSTDEDQNRVRTAILAALAAPGLPLTEGSGSIARGTSAAAGALGGGKVALIIGGIVVVAFAVGVSHRGSRADSGRSQPEVALASAVQQPPAPTVDTTLAPEAQIDAQPAAAPAAVAGGATSTEPEPAPARAAKHSAHRRAADEPTEREDDPDPPIGAVELAPEVEPTVEEPAAEAAPPASSLAAELALIRRARAALGDGALERARNRLEDHRRRFADGHLARERDALWITLACHQGRREAAVSMARAFRQRFGDEALTRSSLSSCR